MGFLDGLIIGVVASLLFLLFAATYAVAREERKFKMSLATIKAAADAQTVGVQNLSASAQGASDRVAADQQAQGDTSAIEATINNNTDAINAAKTLLDSILPAPAPTNGGETPSA